MRETIVSTCQKNFVLKAAAQNVRLDGRKLEECRDVEIIFGKKWGSCVVSLGETKVLSQVTCEVQQPKTTKPNEGLLFINVELNQMAAPQFEPGRGSEFSVHINRILERCIKDSRAVDLESLCIVADEKVWVLRVDVNVLNHEGNLVDCASIACLASLMHFKRPDVTTDGSVITVHSIEDRDPIPITLHHHPLCVSFAFLNSGKQILIDPTSIEERTSEAWLVFGVNGYKELCGLHVAGGALIQPHLLLKCSSKAAFRARELVQMLKEELAKDVLKRQSANSVGMVQCVEWGSLTSSSQKRLKIQLSSRSTRTIVEKVVKAETEMEVVEEEDSSEEDSNKVKIVKLENGAAEMVVPVHDNIIEVNQLENKTFGKGGPSKWEVQTTAPSVVTIDSEDDDDDDNKEVQIIPPSPKADPKFEELVLSGDSEEDEVHFLGSKELETPKPAAQRNKANTSSKKKKKKKKKKFQK